MAFIRPTLNELINRIQSDIDSRLPGSDSRLRYSLLQVIARAAAALAHGLYGYIDFLAKQIIADTAEKEFLERQASIRQTVRAAAVKAVGSVTFTGVDATVIPATTVLQRSDGTEYTTDADGTVASGTVLIAVTAVVAAAAGNTVAGSSLQLASPIAGIDSTAIVDSNGLTNGADIETDDSLRAEYLRKIQKPPQGGNKEDYITWALEVNEITRAWCYPGENGLGTVTVRCVVDNNATSIIPDAAKIAEVQALIDAEMPVTADVTVVAPVLKPLNLEIALTPNDAATQAAVQAELDDMLRRDAEPGSTVLISRIREAISLAAGETDHTLISPAANVTQLTGEIAALGVITWA